MDEAHHRSCNGIQTMHLGVQLQWWCYLPVESSFDALRAVVLHTHRYLNLNLNLNLNTQANE